MTAASERDGAGIEERSSASCARRGCAHELRVTNIVRVETEASVWLVTPDRYLRLPKSEAPRPRFGRGDGGLDDGIWHPHRGVFLVHGRMGDHLRMIPAWRPPGSAGVATGIILTARPPHDVSDDDASS